MITLRGEVWSLHRGAQIATVHKFKGGTEFKKKFDLCAELELLLFEFG
jgi:hypothetical protein